MGEFPGIIYAYSKVLFLWNFQKCDISFYIFSHALSPLINYCSLSNGEDINYLVFFIMAKNKTISSFVVYKNVQTLSLICLNFDVTSDFI